MSARRLRPAAERNGTPYDALKDKHLEEFYARRADVRWNLADLGLVTSTRRVVDNSEHHMRLVDRALAVLELPDPKVSRESNISARGDKIAKLVEADAHQAASKQQKVLGQYAKERLRRVEKREQQRRFAANIPEGLDP